jgi:uncharacterized repeat protein (TIGR01451 family)
MTSQRSACFGTATATDEDHPVTAFSRLWISVCGRGAVRRSALLTVLAFAALLPIAAPAAAAAEAPRLTIHSLALPTSFSESDTANCIANFTECDRYQVSATNSGSQPTHGAIVLTDSLPAGLSIHEFKFVKNVLAGEIEELTAECKPEGNSVKCRHTASLKPDQSLELRLAVTVQPGAVGGEVNTAEVTGGESPGASLAEADVLDSPAPFGIRALSPYLPGPDGEPSTQAGGHPYEFVTRFDLDTRIKPSPESQVLPTSVEDLRDAVVDLPPGLIGSATATPEKCTLIQLTTLAGCPPDTRVGNLRTDPEAIARVNSGLFNMVPEHGVAAEFGFVDVLNTTHVIYASVVPTAQGYTTRATTPETPQVGITDAIATFFGDPAAKDGGEAGTPMFANPADCSGEPLNTTIHVDSWQSPGPYDADGTPNFSDPRWAGATAQTPAVTGCNQLSFEPTISATPETNRADSPTGLEVDLRVPQTEGPETLATPPLKKAVVTLPEGMTVNPSSANGLEGCSLAALGMSASGEPDAAAPTCPDASKIGSVELETPALPGVLQGDIYVARQTENPFHSLLALYIVVDDPTTGVIVKLPGEIRANAVTGQLETVVDNSPQFPFSELRTHFFGGQRAALRTPSVCGTYTVTSSLTPWSAPESGPPATPSASFEITQGCASSAGTEPNHPGFSAGTLDPLAGAYSPFVLKLTREDASQEFKGLSLTLPEGLIGKLAGIPYCPDATLAAAAAKSGLAEQASPSCPAASEVGSVTVGAGSGLEPFYATGRAYLAGPYKGAPLSLAVITPAVAGPFDLGDVVIRNALQVNPETTQITAVSDEIPHILQGIPLDIRSIALKMNRSQFTLNPTNCEKKSITGTASTVQGQSAVLANPFQVGGCKQLGFKPSLKLSLKGSTKHAGHPALKAVLTYPKQGAYANIAKAQVNLPGSEFIDQGNLNKTCTKPVLLAGNCPASTIYGKVKAWTPLLEAPLEGPVYLVGGYGFKLPALVAELDGQIKVLLVGKVDSGPNKGIRNTFETVPDAPVEKFELNLKGGPKYSLLENSENLCAKPQKAIADFTAQSGKVLDLKPTITNSCKTNGGKGKKGGKHRKKHKGTGKQNGGGGSQQKSTGKHQGSGK